MSVSSVRLSDIVRMAMFTGTNGRLGSVFGMFGDLDLVAVIAVIAGPAAFGERIERGRGLTQPVPIDPEVGENVLDEGAGLAAGNGLDEQQRIFRSARGALPAPGFPGPAFQAAASRNRSPATFSSASNIFKYLSPRAMFDSGRLSCAEPASPLARAIYRAVEGMSCITPRAPARLTACGLKFDSCRISA